MAPYSDPTFCAVERRVTRTVATLRRLLDSTDIEWVRERLDAKSARRVRREHRAAFFHFVREFASLAARVRREGTASGTMTLEQAMQFDAEVKWLLAQLRFYGWMVFLGLPSLGTACDVIARLESIALPSRS